MEILRGESRGRAEHGWLSSRHSFSFGDYFDPGRMGFRALRVINEDRIAPGQGFPTHGHRNMEILTYVVEGAVEHRDSLGSGSVIRPGELQRMSAGRGIRHSEFNALADRETRLLQIWILPAEEDTAPSYEQRDFSSAFGREPLQLVASPDGRSGSLRIGQDAELWACRATAGGERSLRLARGGHAWVQLAGGRLELPDQGVLLQAGDGAALSGPGSLRFRWEAAVDFLCFDLA